MALRARGAQSLSLLSLLSLSLSFCVCAHAAGCRQRRNLPEWANWAGDASSSPDEIETDSSIHWGGWNRSGSDNVMTNSFVPSLLSRRLFVHVRVYRQFALRQLFAAQEISAADEWGFDCRIGEKELKKEITIHPVALPPPHPSSSSFCALVCFVCVCTHETVVCVCVCVFFVHRRLDEWEFEPASSPPPKSKSFIHPSDKIIRPVAAVAVNACARARVQPLRFAAAVCSAANRCGR